MKADYLINLIEEYCNENNLDISEFYEKMSEIYQSEWGVNIVLQAKEKGKWSITEYLEELGIIDRYISILNKIKRGLV
jgi:hypothetical protein